MSTSPSKDIARFIARQLSPLQWGQDYQFFSVVGGRDRLEVQGTALGFSYSELSKTGCKEEPVVVARQEDQEFKV